MIASRSALSILHNFRNGDPRIFVCSPGMSRRTTDFKAPKLRKGRSDYYDELVSCKGELFFTLSYIHAYPWHVAINLIND